MTGATVTANRSAGVWSGFARIESSTITDNGLEAEGFARYGMYAGSKSRVKSSTITGNGMGGIEGWRIRLDDTTVTGNNAYAECATKACADVSSRYSLRLRGTSTCDHSIDQGKGDEPGSWIGQPLPADIVNWGVCALD